MNEDYIGEDILGDDDYSIAGDDDAEVIGAALGRRRLRALAAPGRTLHLPAKPAWRRAQLAPGVYGPREARELLPLSPSANNGVFDAANANIRFSARPQKPFLPQRIVVNVRRSAGASGITVRGSGLVVGTDPNLVEINDFDLEVFSGTNFGVGLRMRPASPGINISIPAFVVPTVPAGESVAVTIAMLGSVIT